MLSTMLPAQRLAGEKAGCVGIELTSEDLKTFQPTCRSCTMLLPLLPALRPVGLELNGKAAAPLQSGPSKSSAGRLEIHRRSRRILKKEESNAASSGSPKTPCPSVHWQVLDLVRPQHRFSTRERTG